MSKDAEKKDHSVRNGVITGIIVTVVAALVTDLNTLFLAHIWPITIHFGEYSFNNFLFILIDGAITVVILLIAAYVFLFLGMMSVFAMIARGLLWLATPPEQRKEIKSSWYERIPSFMFAPIAWAFSLRKKQMQPQISENAKRMLEHISDAEKKEQEQVVTIKQKID